MAGDRAELEELRRLDALEAKAAGKATAPPSEPPSTARVALNAIPKGVANLLNTPVAIENLARAGLSLIPGVPESYTTPKPNRPMELAEQVGLVDPAMNPQTGVQRIVDTAIQAGVSNLIVPGSGVRSAVVGATSGAVGQTVEELTGSKVAGLVAGVVTPLALRSVQSRAKSPLQTPGREQTLKDARALGFVVEPASVKPSASVNRVSDIAGKASIAQEAAIRNQQAANRVAARSLELPDDSPITPSVLEQVRKRAAQPYEEIEQLRQSLKQSGTLSWFPRYHSPSLIEELKQARADTTALYRAYYHSATPDPAILNRAKQSQQLVDAIERDIEMIANVAGKPELIDRLAKGRQLLAKSYDVEKALNIGDFNVSLPVLGRMLDQGRPLSGELATAGRFAQAFPRVAREGATIPPPTSSGATAASSAVLGTAGYAAAGGPAGMLAAGLPLLRGPARNYLLSKGYQNSLLREPVSLATAGARAALTGRTLLEME